MLCLLGYAVQGVVSRAPVLFLYATDPGKAKALPDPLLFLFAIHGRALAHGFFWTPVTYMFLHGTWTHLLLNAIGLVVMGSAVEGVLGTRRFWSVFLWSGIVGGVGWGLAQPMTADTPCVGASAGVLGLIGCYAALRPRDRFLLVFPFPVTITARTLALWLAAANAIDLAFGHGQIAYLAHLVGLVAGAGYGTMLRGGTPGVLRRIRTWRIRPRPEAQTLDAVLEKIHREGLRNLGEAERKILQDAAHRGLEGRSGHGE